MRVPISLLLSVAVCACAAAPPSQESITAAAASWQAAYNSRDPMRIAAMYDDDAVLWGTTSKTIAPTPSAIGAYFKDSASRPTARVTLGEQHVRVYGDIAVDSGYYTFSEVREGQPVERPARFTFVFRKRSGQWLLVAHHSSQMP